MATISEFTQLVSLFVEALDRLSADKSEVVQAQETLAAAQAALAKEEADVGGSSAGLVAAWDGVKAAGDSLVAALIPVEEPPDV
jgi:cysteine synthase